MPPLHLAHLSVPSITAPIPITPVWSDTCPLTLLWSSALPISGNFISTLQTTLLCMVVVYRWEMQWQDGWKKLVTQQQTPTSKRIESTYFSLGWAWYVAQCWGKWKTWMLPDHKSSCHWSHTRTIWSETRTFGFSPLTPFCCHPASTLS